MINCARSGLRSGVQRGGARRVYVKATNTATTKVATMLFEQLFELFSVGLFSSKLFELIRVVVIFVVILVGPMMTCDSPAPPNRSRCGVLRYWRCSFLSRMAATGNLYYTILYYTIPYHTIMYYTIMYYTNTTILYHTRLD